MHNQSIQNTDKKINKHTDKCLNRYGMNELTDRQVNKHRNQTKTQTHAPIKHNKETLTVSKKDKVGRRKRRRRRTEGRER